jgi:hypothetical protein
MLGKRDLPESFDGVSTLKSVVLDFFDLSSVIDSFREGPACR